MQKWTEEQLAFIEKLDEYLTSVEITDAYNNMFPSAPRNNKSIHDRILRLRRERREQCVAPLSK